MTENTSKSPGDIGLANHLSHIVSKVTIGVNVTSGGTVFYVTLINGMNKGIQLYNFTELWKAIHTGLDFAEFFKVELAQVKPFHPEDKHGLTQEQIDSAYAEATKYR